MKMFNVYPRFPINIVKSKGVYLWDDQNRKYLDLYGGHGVISIGHSHPAYVSAISKQLRKIGFYSNSIQIPLQQQLADKLTQLSSYDSYELFLCNSGSEANENAIKLASFYNGKTKLIAFKNSFHGRTSASLNVTNQPNISAPVNKNQFEVEFIELNKEEQLKQALSGSNICAVILEGIQGVGGLDMPSKSYLKELSRLCIEKNIVLILDEIQSGYGRSGKFFSHQHHDIKADIITMAKGMGNGFPIAGLLINPAIEAKFGMLGTTFGGNHLACAAGISVLDQIVSERLIENAKNVGELLVEDLKSIAEIKKMKGMGLMLGVEFDSPAKPVRNRLLKKYSIFTGASANPNLLRILPPLSIKYEEIKVFPEALKQLFKNQIKLG
jgi:acetylornithine/N-succinyldiaminopimelate aminotransferase